MSKTTKQIIDETISYYQDHPRCIDEVGQCVYLDKTTGNKCALGRALKDEYMEDALNVAGDAESLQDNIDDLDELVMAEYQGHSLEFWSELQSCHDSARYWEDGKINGEMVINRMKEMGYYE